MFRDLRFALRLLRNNPGYASVAVLTLALGIGPNSAVFSAFDQIFLRLLPVDDPRQLVILEIEGPPAPGVAMSDNQQTVFSHPQYLDWKARSGVFQGVIARTSMRALLADGDEGERVAGELISGNFFEVLGVRPALGRLFTSEDDRLEGGHPQVVLSHQFWTRRYAGSDVIDRRIRVNGHPVTIVGVTGPEFRGLLSGGAPDLYMTLAMRKQMIPGLYRIPLPERMVRHLNLLARLRPGASRVQAEEAMRLVFQSIIEEELAQFANRIRDPEEFRERRMLLIPALQGIHTLRERVEEPLISVVALVGLVLLIACVNLAGLLMARGLARSRELAVRTAVGASRLQILRQSLLESSIVAVAGGLAGLLIAFWTLRLLGSWLGEGALALELDGRVVAFNFALAAATCPLFGLLPALQASRSSVLPLLKVQTAGGESRTATNLRKGAVVLQVALSLALLVAAGLFARTLHNLKRFDPGFRTEHLLTFSIDPALNGYDSQRGHALYDELQRSLRALPGVRDAAATQLPLLGNQQMASSLSVEGYEAADRENISTRRNVVSPRFFATLGIPVLLGREFREGDRSGAPQVAIVNQAFVDRYFEGRNPLGRRLSFAGGSGVEDLPMEIIGVVKNQKSSSLREETRPFAYTPYSQENSLAPMTFYLLGAREEAVLGPQVRRTVRDLDPDLPVYGMETMATVRDSRVELERSVALLASAFAAIATLLTAVGLYGLIAYSVTRRRTEMGVRMALGARRREVLTLVLRDAAFYLLAGLVLGLPLALGLGSYLQSQLFGLEAHDPVSVAAAAAVLGTAVLVAALAPALRAAFLDPAQALRL